MNDGFWVSPSQINTFLNEPAIWILNRLYKVKGEMGPAAWRGTAIEKGLTAILHNGLSYEDGLAFAHQVFSQDAATYTGEDAAKEKDLIEPMLKQCIDPFLSYGEIKAVQVKISGEIEGVPIFGYADFDYGDFMKDLKTTKRCPSCAENLASEHVRQLWIYKFLSGKEQRIAYATDKKFAAYTPSETQYWQAEKDVRRAARAMKMAWDLIDDMGSDKVAQLYPPRDMGGFYWDSTTLKAAQEVWA